MSGDGVWPLAGDEALFLPFDEVPWFRDGPVAHILNVEELRPGQFLWPDLDVDLSRAIIREQKRYPLKAKSAR